MKAGDIVRIKSGGLKMTIEYIEEDNVTCVWFDLNNVPQRQVFSINVLTIA